MLSGCVSMWIILSTWLARQLMRLAFSYHRPHLPFFIIPMPSDEQCVTQDDIFIPNTHQERLQWFNAHGFAVYEHSTYHGHYTTALVAAEEGKAQRGSLSMISDVPTCCLLHVVCSVVSRSSQP